MEGCNDENGSLSNNNDYTEPEKLDIKKLSLSVNYFKYFFTSQNNTKIELVLFKAVRSLKTRHEIK